MNINDFSPLVSNVSDSNVSESKDNANFNTEKATDTQGIISLSNLKVLLVDDQHTFVVMMKSMLNALGFSKIDIANNADQAIKICKNNTYDVYLFDYNLGPGL